MVFGNGVKNMQAVAYNGACTVYDLIKVLKFWKFLISLKTFGSPIKAIK